jgi:PAS domain S-box-containing protein
MVAASYMLPEAGQRCGHGGLVAVWLILFVFGLCLPDAAHAASSLDEWRDEVGRTRTLAENDAPRAYEEAQRLQATLPADATPADQARVLNLLARIEIYLALTEQAADHAQLASDLAKQNADRVGQAEADLNVALNSVNQGKIDALIAATTHSMAVLDGVDRSDLLSEALLRTAMMYRRVGQFDESVTMAMQAMEIARRMNDPLALTFAHQGLGISFDQSFRYAEARDHYLEMRDQARAAHSKMLEAYAIAGLGGTTGSLGDLPGGERLIREALALYRETGSPFAVNFGLTNLGHNLRSQGRDAEALPIFDQVVATYERYPNRIGLWFALNSRSSTYQSLGNIVAALADADRAYAVAKDIGFPLYVSESAQRLATIAAANGDHRRAYELSLEATDMTAKATREKSSARMVELAQRYESESKQREINELTRRNQQQIAELRQRALQQRWLWTVLGGSVAAFVGTVYFLFRLRRSQNDLQDQTLILQSVLDSMGDGVSVANERGELLLVNPAGKKMAGIGLTPDDSGGCIQGNELYLPDQTTPYPPAESPFARALRGESCDDVEIFVLNPLETEGRWLSVTARPLTDKGGIARGGVAVFSDITARKRAEEEIRTLNANLEQRVRASTAELRQQTRYLRTLIDTLPLMVWLKDTDSRYLAANQANTDARGLAMDEIIGKSDFDLWPRELAEAYRADDAEVMASRRRKTMEERFADIKGTVWIETYKAPVFDEDGTVLGTVGFARDISEHKAMDAAREAALAEAVRLARLRSAFLAQMSHELRTPLNAVLGYAQILQHDKHLTDRQARGLATIRESGQHLLTLINDILDLSRIDAAKLELFPTAINLSVFLMVVADIIRVKAEEKSLLFIHQTPPDLPAAVRMDGKRLRQVLLNLLGNAVKFTDTGQVTLRVKVTSLAGLPQWVDSDGKAMVRLRFEVEDGGIGMSGEQLARIFLPFEQVAEVQRREGGAGLGLAISQQLVRLMGGDIRVRSQLGGGSLFWFELDLPVAETQTTLLPAPRNATGYEGLRKKVLVVDDVPQNRAMLMDALTPLGFEVSDATNGQEGLAQAESIRPDLIVMDVMMPVMDGLEATRRIRLLPGLAQVPIIVVTASATREDESRSYAAGARAFIPKPIDEEVLLKAIGQHLALTWTYEELGQAAAEAAWETSDIVVPPRDEIEFLHRLAQEGDMRSIRERADFLKGLDARYAPFAQRLWGLAEGYQSKAIVALIERHRTGDERHRDENPSGEASI